MLKDVGGEIISIDGKTCRGSHDRTKGKKPIHMVSAWANENRIVLGQVKTEEKSNEITAIPELLKAIDIASAVVTIDAMGCQKDIVKEIRSKNAEYVISLKGNQSRLQEKVEDFFTCYSNESNTITLTDEEQKAHGRVEQREYFLAEIPGHFNEKYIWEGLTCIGKVRSSRLIDGNLTVENRYFITSLKTSEFKRFAAATRRHWGIENSLHYWQFDISFSEDRSRKRSGNAAQNFSLVRKIALNYLKNDKTRKGGIERKRRYASLNTEYLQTLISQ
ncbi:MAG: hypothetical protein A2096_12695 [Spirochaetes bacterium GWF1_41_5]|nr:MAG: hypothetical protein A2096_12695 [Spirochaetes bacterium GWF1_41_5]